MTPATDALSNALLLTIAGVTIKVLSRVPLVDQYDSPYLQFVDPDADGEAASSMRVSVLSTPNPPNDAPLLFESGGAWSMQPEASGYRLNFHRDGSDEFHTIACSNADTTEVQVYVDQDAPPEPAGLGQTNPICYPLDQLLLINHLSSRGGVVVHAGAAVVDGRALVYLGASGAGKSTLSRLFVGVGLGAGLLSDDRVILRTEPNGVSTRCEVWGTPWPGDAGIAVTAHAPLAALFFLVKSEINKVVPLAPAVGMKRIMPVASCPLYDPDRLPAVVDTCARIVENYPCYDLHFRLDSDVVSLLAGGNWGNA